MKARRPGISMPCTFPFLYVFFARLSVSTLFVPFAFSLLVLILASPLFAQDFTINRFHADITLNEDSSFLVKETIDVEFHRPRHGIYREIPFQYTDELGDTIITPLNILSVTDASGKECKKKIETRNNILHIRIGDADKYVAGNLTYVILYKVENAILFLNDHDELYWNVTGNYWKAPVQAASANVLLPAKNKSRNLWASCYTGASGSRESQCRYDTYPNNAEFFTKRNLNPGEGLTIAFGWDKGLVNPPSSWKRFLWAINLSENWVFIFPLASLIFMTTLWYKRGRDPHVRESITVMYGPPTHNGIPLTPAEAGALTDERLDSRDITSSIVGLAVKGHIKIEEIKKEGLIFDRSDYYLSKIKDSGDDLSSFERILMKGIFTDPASPGILVSDMKNKFYTHLDALKTALNGELVHKKFFLRSPDKIRNYYIVAAIIVTVFVTVLGGVFYASFTTYSGAKNFFAGILSGLFVLAFSRVMPAKTRAGAFAYMEILGFQEFLNRAEKDKLARMGDKDLFSKFLPYAIALDVAENWAKAFEGIYQNPPEWYVSPGGFRTFTPHTFSRSMNSMTSSLGAALFSTPRGSGISSGRGSGGGSSGGGFGGGGGGSW